MSNELEEQAQEQIDALYSGTNESNESEQAEELQEDTQEEEISEELQDEQVKDEQELKETQPKSKAEKNFEKILKKKNQYKNQSEEALARVQKLENDLLDERFYKSHPQAEALRDDINAVMEEFSDSPSMTRERAFAMVANEKWVSARPKGIIGTPAQATPAKTTKDMSSAELTDYAKANDILWKALRGE